MTRNRSLTALAARLVVPVMGEPIEDGVVVIEGDRLVQVGREIPPGADVVNLNDQNNVTSGGVAILPGLINAHTHLEFSNLDAPLGEAGMSFPDWIRAVIEQRRHRQSKAGGELPQRAAAIQRGYSECIASGITTIGEIATSYWPAQLIADAACGACNDGPDMILFHEVLGLADDRAEAIAAELGSFQKRTAGVTPRWKVGVSPHAPYSTHWSVVKAACDYSRDHHVSLAMHLAESPEELELLETHGGPFRELLDELGVWNAAGIPRGNRALDYLQLLSSAHRALVIHGNYLNDEEIAFIGENADRMSLVYCPRTHAYFQHTKYPLSKLLTAGVNVALGTDSRASNPDLNLLAEMRTVADVHPEISPADIVRMGTIQGTQALGRDRETGALQPGKRADLTIIALPEETFREPTEAILHTSLPTIATYTGGAPIEPRQQEHKPAPNSQANKSRTDPKK